MRVNRSEARTDHIHIRVRPSIKQMAVAMAKAEERSLSIFISRLIEAEAMRSENATESRLRSGLASGH
jgi:predicted HicB family RNase H-like nuclease